ncbi:Inositol 2-dehydrogenase/D-chiro-inositol 3-dehydrogenase [Rubripirellula lacrimiformis]|uniref:Inositol 2-dehydrogenase/D-chiro-inositol 3-dehydrogenase n=1 Tax=Rubripirellula lacrimiformis TaxID=1930273 RepID=A0A517NBK5_9BACT|nr:Gfo/Idh/MocA family oxidoreductase [Rubripirellula lacrimiformis]QDT04500.1 Inositol 2-dehydrogenase/D-chiro-inositol 3-dehydrogenase [Rubripirellula lacrimiformis]
MNPTADRRLFLQGVAALSASALSANAMSSPAAAAEKTDANSRVSIGIMGTGSRGSAISKGMLKLGSVDIAAVCDVDQAAAQRTADSIAKSQTKRPEVFSDFRQMLDQDSIDAIVCAAPNHWHAPATIMGCQAGKHVYVEKPCSHNPAEGEMAIQAARAANRVVQMGTQRRSWPAIIEAVDRIHSGTIGEALYSRCWYNNRRPSIGHGTEQTPPDGFDWDLWQGPAPRVAFKDNVVPYNWHWNWLWGNGELGNNGVHAIDVARWGLQATYPERVTAGGGKYRHDDDQETPDTMMVTYDFPDKKTITWEGLSWSPLGPHGSRFGLSFHGTEGSIVINGSGFVLYDMKDKQIDQQTGAGGDQDHFADFVDAIRNDRRPNADIEIAHQSTLLCHLGNIAYRTESVLHTDPQNGRIVDNPDAAKLWSRSYADGWQPKV